MRATCHGHWLIVVLLPLMIEALAPDPAAVVEALPAGGRTIKTASVIATRRPHPIGATRLTIWAALDIA